jgi:omega-hydroxy-beta-dihydromenaquinone-9 sulfotransferase
MSERYAFVLGTGRCGSTLVQEVLARHPDVGFVTNLDDRFRVRSGRRQIAAYRRMPAGFTPKGRARFAPSEAYRALAREVSPLLVDPMRDLTAADATPWLSQRLRTFFRRRAEAQRLPLFLHKFTGFPRAGLLATVFPEARFVHVVRDGRAVANSWLAMPWWRGYRAPPEWHFGILPDHLDREWHDSGRSFVVLAGLAWRLLTDAFIEAAAKLPSELWLELRYEDIVKSPEEKFREMADFLGLGWTPRFGTVVNRTPFHVSRANAYLEDLGADHAARLERVLNSSLSRYGYL